MAVEDSVLEASFWEVAEGDSVLAAAFCEAPEVDESFADVEVCEVLDADEVGVDAATPEVLDVSALLESALLEAWDEEVSELDVELLVACELESAVVLDDELSAEAAAPAKFCAGPVVPAVACEVLFVDSVCTLDDAADS